MKMSQYSILLEDCLRDFIFLHTAWTCKCKINSSSSMVFSKEQKAIYSKSKESFRRSSSSDQPFNLWGRHLNTFVFHEIAELLHTNFKHPVADHGSDVPLRTWRGALEEFVVDSHSGLGRTCSLSLCNTLLNQYEKDSPVIFVLKINNCPKNYRITIKPHCIYFCDSWKYRLIIHY